MGKSACVLSATLRGTEIVAVSVEIDIAGGIPGITIVGMPDVAVQEAKSRVRSAIKACGFTMPRAHVVVNLAPSDVRKSGAGFDLPIALGILVATGQVPAAGLENCLVVGELSLDGSVRTMRGMVAYEVACKQLGKTLIAGTHEGEMLTVSGVDRRVVRWLSDFLLPYKTMQAAKRSNDAFVHDVDDMRDVVGQDIPKRALTIAAAGRHGLLLIGPPGSGKTMLASRLPGILPALSEEEIMDSALIHSVVGESITPLFAGKRPFRSPHHSITHVGLIGGGRPVKPGEVSLAHNGVLFLDELPEFSPRALQSLRQPLEEKVVRIVRSEGSFTFPANFQFVAAANPCPCGYLGDAERACTCSAAKIESYQSRIGGPLMDRFDMVVEVFRPKARHILTQHEEVSTAQIQQQIVDALAFKADRQAHQAIDKELSLKDTVLSECDMKGQTKRLFESAARTYHLTARGILKIARVARTIADLDGSARVTEEHLTEALAFRVGEHFT